MLEVMLYVVKIVSERGSTIQSLADIKAQLVELISERDNLSSQVSQLSRQRDELVRIIEQTNIEAGQVITKAEDEANRIVSGAKEEANRISTVDIEKDTFTIEQRQAVVLLMHLQGHTISEIAISLKVSEGTIKNDKKVWNGQLKKLVDF